MTMLVVSTSPMPQWVAIGRPLAKFTGPPTSPTMRTSNGGAAGIASLNEASMPNEFSTS